jgi:hypothetical protein
LPFFKAGRKKNLREVLKGSLKASKTYLNYLFRTVLSDFSRFWYFLADFGSFFHQIRPREKLG